MIAVSLAAVVVAIVSHSAAGRDGAALRRLVYTFSYSESQNVAARDTVNAAEWTGSGISHYSGAVGDKGTMIVDVIRRQPDGALVVAISEQGENVRRAPAAECVVYGDTNVICDPNKTVYIEEYALLRFLGGNFVDPGALDGKRHWQIAQNTPTLDLKADYTINSSSNGILQIGETRSMRNPKGGSLTTDAQSKIGYDFTRSFPITVDEYVTQRHDDGFAGTTTTIYQTTLHLVSDTMGKT